MTRLTGYRRLLPLLLLIVCLGAGAAPKGYRGHAPISKPLAPIAIDYALAGEPALGRPLGIRVTIVPEYGLDDVVVTFTPAEGLALDAAANEHRYDALAPGEALELDVSVIPLLLGRLGLGVTVTGDLQGAPQVRSVSVPVRLVGEVDKTPAPLEIGADGEVLHTLPARRPPRGVLR